MRIGVLLEELIDIAQITKTDFALSMNMTPSGLSKILTGKRLPFSKEKRMFSQQAAGYFSDAIYSSGCYLKFEKLFPVIYDFSSKYELEIFLTYAIKYALDIDFAAENNDYKDFPNRYAESFLGKKTILNMFCIILSDYINKNDSLPLELYGTLPLCSQLYSDIFSRIKTTDSKRQKSISLNYFFDMSSFEASCDECNIDILSCITKMQQYCDLNLWMINKAIDSAFLLLKGQFLLLFSIQMEGTPLMTLISHKSYLNVFFNSLMKRNAKKISYSKSEAVAAIEANPALVDQLIDRHIDVVYNFISIGYLIDKKDLEVIEGKEIIKSAILKLFQAIMVKETVFSVTVDAMMNFCATGKAIVPLLGAIDIKEDQRVPYLQRFDPYLDKEDPDKIKIINCDQPKVAIVCSRGLSIVYLIDSDYSSEKIHCFETDKINNILEKEMTGSNIKTLDFSPDLWDSYLDALSTNIHTPIY